MSTTQPVPETPGPIEKYRILVAEDEPNIGRLITMNLTKAGFECHHVADGLAAVRDFPRYNPHLVMLDVMMPGMNGRDVCVKIRETSTVPIIMLTALDTEQDQLQGFKIGADDYIAKPFNPNLMVARVISNLRRVYRYDATELAEPQAEAVRDSIPDGWATCEACGYMGPRHKFQNEKSTEQIPMRCPLCGRHEFIVFPLRAR